MFRISMQPDEATRGDLMTFVKGLLREAVPAALAAKFAEDGWAPDKVRGTAAETGKIGAWLENPLTFEGRQALRERWHEERCKRAEDRHPAIAFAAECYELDSTAVQGVPCSECKGTSWILNDQMDEARCEECGHERAVEPRP